MKHYKKLTMIALFGLIGCASDPKINELPMTADAQKELQQIEQDLQQAELEQVDVLSPQNYRRSKDAVNKAIKARSQNADQKEVLHQISLARHDLQKAATSSQLAHQVMHETIKAQALVHNKKEMKAADDDLTDLTSDIEDNDLKEAREKNSKMTETYEAIEIKALKKEKLGASEDLVALATKEGAEKLTPETYKWTQNIHAASARTIENNPHDEFQVEKASLQSAQASQRLIKMVREAKSSESQNPEDLAKRVEKNELTENQFVHDLDRAEKSNAELSDQAWTERRYEHVRGQLSPSEADIYNQRDVIMIRLKGLSFSENGKEIRSADFPLMSKVQKVLESIQPTEIRVEGHTDSIEYILYFSLNSPFLPARFCRNHNRNHNNGNLQRRFLF